MACLEAGVGVQGLVHWSLLQLEVAWEGGRWEKAVVLQQLLGRQWVQCRLHLSVCC